jgi:hypothetical protein
MDLSFKRVFVSGVTIAFQDVFRLEIYQNNTFIFKKLFLILTC